MVAARAKLLSIPAVMAPRTPRRVTVDTPTSPLEPPVVESDSFLYRPSPAVEQQLQRLADLQISLARLAGGMISPTPAEPALSPAALPDATLEIQADAAGPSPGTITECGSELPSSNRKAGRGRHRDRQLGLFRH
jgi:hypothetical protein